MKVKRAVPGRASCNPAALEDHERNTAGIGLCAVETDAKQRDQRDQGASQQDRNSHGNFRLQSLRHGRERFPSVHLTRREMTWLIPAESIPAYATVGYSLEAQTKASERYERNKREVKRTDLGEHVPIVQPLPQSRGSCTLPVGAEASCVGPFRVRYSRLSR